VSTQAAPCTLPRGLESGMTHREVLEAMSGLLLGMFVAILSSTVVSTALPKIIGDLGGSQSSYTWVVTDGLGWRWCFYVGVPFSVAAFVVLQRTLHLPRRRRVVSIDYAGGLLIAAGVSALLIWVSLAGQEYDWVSWQTAAFVGR